LIAEHFAKKPRQINGLCFNSEPCLDYILVWGCKYVSGLGSLRGVINLHRVIGNFSSTQQGMSGDQFTIGWPRYFNSDLYFNINNNCASDILRSISVGEHFACCVCFFHNKKAR
jgi:hypothetical protein